MGIVVSGHICLDIIPQWSGGDINSMLPGHVLEMDGVEISTGGSMANVGIALHRLGYHPLLLGKIGDDAFGRIIQGLLNKQDTALAQHIIISSQDRSSYTIVLNPPDTDRIFLHFPGSNDTLTSADIAYDCIEDANLFHFGYPPFMKQFYQNDGEEIVRMMKKIQQMGLLTSLDMAMPDPQKPAGKIDWQKLLKNVLPHIDIFVPSLDEILYMCKRNTYHLFQKKRKRIELGMLEQLADQLIDWGAAIVLIKLGDQGLYLQTTSLWHPRLVNLLDQQQWSSRKLFSACFKTLVSGTTGTGDATIAGFLSQVSEGAGPTSALVRATATGAYCVEARDATSGIPSIAKMNQRINKGWPRLSTRIPTKGWQWIANDQLWEKKNKR